MQMYNFIIIFQLWKHYNQLNEWNKICFSPQSACARVCLHTSHKDRIVSFLMPTHVQRFIWICWFYFILFFFPLFFICHSKMIICSRMCCNSITIQTTILSLLLLLLHFDGFRLFFLSLLFFVRPKLICKMQPLASKSVSKLNKSTLNDGSLHGYNSI